MDQPPQDNPFQAPREDLSGVSGRARGGSDSELEALDWVLAVFCSGIACILGIVWMIQGKPKGAKMVGVSFLFAFVWNLVRIGIAALSQQL